MERETLIAARLRGLRESKRLSHERLARAMCEKYGISISKSSLLNYEAGAVAGMRAEYLCCFADFYGVSTDFLLALSDEPNRRPTAVDELHLSPNAVEQLAAENTGRERQTIYSGILESLNLVAIVEDIISLKKLNNPKDPPRETIQTRKAQQQAESDFRKATIYEGKLLYGRDYAAFLRFDIQRELQKLVDGLVKGKEA